MSTQAAAVAIGTAITAKIQTISGAFCAAFDLVPEFDLPQVQSLKIIVAPQSYSRGNKGAASRKNPDELVKINVAVMKKCSGKADIPALLLLMENIAKGIERQPVSGDGTAGLVISVEFDPLYDAEAFRQTKVFIAVCSATVKVLR